MFVFFGLALIVSMADNDDSMGQQNIPITQQQEKRAEDNNRPIVPAEEDLKKPATIPGISAVDVYGNLKNIGFSCSGPDVGSDGLKSWECKEKISEHMYLVEILGEDPSEIFIVQATALNYGSKSIDTVAKDFFGYVASVPYDNSDQVFAKKWIIENISQKTNKVIGGVRFTIKGNERSRILTIANENSDLD